MSQSKLSIEETEHQDKVILNWNIPNFNALYDAARADSKISIVQEKFTMWGLPWGFCLRPSSNNNHVIMVLRLLPDTVSSVYTVHLKSSNHAFPFNTGMPMEETAAPENPCVEEPLWWQLKSLSKLQNEGFLKDNTLQLQIIVWDSSKGQLKMNVSKDLKNGLDSGLGSDVNFIFVEDDQEGSQNVIGEIKAHSQILSLRSSVFATMFRSGMKEAKEGEVEISDISPKAFKILLKFLYSGEVDGEWGYVVEELIYAADKYDLAELQSYLCANVDSVLTARNVWRIRELGALHKLSQILKSTMKFIKENTEAALQNVQEVILTKDGSSV